MTTQKKKALELIEKFGDKSIEVIQEVILYVTNGEPDWAGKTIELQELQNEIRSMLANESCIDDTLVNTTIPQSKKELLDCIQNLMGVFDTPVGRLRMKSQFADEVRKIGRQILETNERSNYQI